MRGPAMRWIGRSRPCFPIWQAQALKPSQHPWNITSTLTPLTRSISSQPQSRLSGTTATTTTTTTTSSSKESKSRKWTLFLSNAAVAGGLAFVAAALLTNRGSSSDSDRTALNKSTFVPFAITSKEQVSPSAFILTVRPSSNGHRDAATSSAPIASAWQHGLWSVEIKQPQLQIARHYTPLPPLPISSPAQEIAEGGGGKGEEKGGGEEEAELRFLIRRMDGGEMSTYLSKRAVGDVIWLRGPHLGFDIARRLGSGSESDNGGGGGGGGHVVFLAGGTGVAPALQIARRLLDSGSDFNSNSNSSDNHNPNPPTTLTILWANRLAADAQGRPSPSPSPSPGPAPWWQLRIPFWSTPPPHHHNHVPPPPSSPSSSSSSLARQIQALQQRHPARFRISYYVDEEGTFIGPRDLLLASSLPLPPHYPHPHPDPDPNPDPDPSCPWHSTAAISSLSDDADAGACPCPGPGTRGAHARSLLCVSGPDGFVEAYAGPKRWRDGRETQGAVGGLLGRMMTTMMRDDWIVLKL
ncbi:hypothetical protein F5X96DRAFT_488540 [Biscogniauxia mediterranea]|nr:hypothetical protein F5X96DRAFT_488540 [Biscogniauxia mediterranea]